MFEVSKEKGKNKQFGVKFFKIFLLLKLRFYKLNYCISVSAYCIEKSTHLKMVCWPADFPINHGQTQSIRLKPVPTFHFRQGRSFAACTSFAIQKLTNLEWKTKLKQLLGSLLLALNAPKDIKQHIILRISI